MEMLVYHFLDRKYGLQNIRKRRLKIAVINDLNDPFEMIAAASPTEDVRCALLKTKDELSARFGLLCFSRNWKNAVQWAHYAESHKGLCLGFEAPDDLLKPVRYQRRRIIINPDEIYDGSAAGEVFAQALISTKSSHWRYENEVRCFAELKERDRQSGLYFKEFCDQLILREVIVGHCSTISRGELSDALGHLSSSVTAKMVRLAFRTFEIVTQRCKDLWH